MARTPVRALAACSWSYRPVVAGFLLDSLLAQRARHPLAEAGFCGGRWEAIYAALDIIAFKLGEIDRSQAFRGLGGGAPDYFWLDTRKIPEM